MSVIALMMDILYMLLKALLSSHTDQNLLALISLKFNERNHGIP